MSMESCHKSLKSNVCVCLVRRAAKKEAKFCFVSATIGSMQMETEMFCFILDVSSIITEKTVQVGLCEP